MEHPVIINSRGELTTTDNNLSGVMSRYINTPAGKRQLAQSMIAPIRRRLDYQGIARQVFHVEQLPQGAVPYYYGDPDGSKES